MDSDKAERIRRLIGDTKRTLRHAVDITRKAGLNNLSPALAGLLARWNDETPGIPAAPDATMIRLRPPPGTRAGD